MVKTRMKKTYPDGTVEIIERWEYEDSVEYANARDYNKKHCIKYEDYYKRIDSPIQETSMKDILDAFKEFKETINSLM